MWVARGRNVILGIGVGWEMWEEEPTIGGSGGNGGGMFIPTSLSMIAHKTSAMASCLASCWSLFFCKNLEKQFIDLFVIIFEGLVQEMKATMILVNPRENNKNKFKEIKKITKAKDY
ncbi:unnamed protein product [Lupinus luteus]|uniref:Uncharacterized protein n=1 Tax=Lupinus luteus TaxID=3873 RepID=A0AAV1Y8I8_LUPLU